MREDRVVGRVYGWYVGRKSGGVDVGEEGCFVL